MNFYSTKDRTNVVSLQEAVMKSLASDGGLYMPEEIPRLSTQFFNDLSSMTFEEISYAVSSELLVGSIDLDVLKTIVNRAINFKAPVVMLDDKIGSLELWHGPSLAFKDFGARFMAGMMSHFADQGERLTILVATSGDTGGAVAYGFLGVPNIDVVILYPKDKVSPLQEKQLTTLGQNITACEVNGTFDDCQAIVKKAFLDPVLNRAYNLSSANSINIARLIPQSFYYFEAYKQVVKIKSDKIAFSVPSGNFGNLTAGLIAYKMGLPIHQFIAATNANNVVPSYLDSGVYKPAPSIATISNAMDVGSPSNFERIRHLFGDDHTQIKDLIKGYFYSDEETRSQMKLIKKEYGYTADPHGAIGHRALATYLADQPSNVKGVFLETAHPAKFKAIVEAEVGPINVPTRLSELADKEKVAKVLEADFEAFKQYLLGRQS